ncbi:uncharacterized protein DS421_16g543110 [Arachis hypogaea]|nr:uncharacterized protein DS421_16g543110 [Arachis hypogaea]
MHRERAWRGEKREREEMLLRCRRDMTAGLLHARTPCHHRQRRPVLPSLQRLLSAVRGAAESILIEAMPSQKEPEEGDEPEPRAGGRRRRRASRRRRALVQSKEPPLEEEGLMGSTITNIAKSTQRRGRKDLRRCQGPVSLLLPSESLFCHHQVWRRALPLSPLKLAGEGAINRRTAAALILYYSVLLCSASASGFAVIGALYHWKLILGLPRTTLVAA